MASRMRLTLPGLSWAFQKDQEQDAPPAQDPVGASEKEGGLATIDDDSSQELTAEAQDGVKQIEAMAIVWTNTELYTAYASSVHFCCD